MNDTSWWARLNNHLLELALGLGLLLVGLFRVLLPVLGVTGPLSPVVDSRDVRLDTAARIPGVPASAGVALRGTGHAELVFSHPGVTDRLLLVLPGLVSGLLLVVVFEVLLRVARTFRDGDFFVPRNARRLTVVAVAVLLIGILVPVLDTVTTNGLVAGTPVERAVPGTYRFDVLPVFLALLIAAAAGAFRNGTRLRADTEGLV